MSLPTTVDVERALLKRGWLAHQSQDFQRTVLQRARLVSLRFLYAETRREPVGTTWRGTIRFHALTVITE